MVFEFLSECKARPCNWKQSKHWLFDCNDGRDWIIARSFKWGI